MAGLALNERDLAATREQLRSWFAHRLDSEILISELQPANRAAGWSSESLMFTVTADETTRDYVVRIPPAGGGIFPTYDLQSQARTQELLQAHGVPTPTPSIYEPDESWIGTRFLVMPRIVGHTPSDTTFATRGWLHGAGSTVQRRVHDSFLDTLINLHRVPVADAPWLRRTTGDGLTAELAWWKEYLAWGSDDRLPASMTAAFEWLGRHQPSPTSDLVVCWGDARLSNAIFDDAGEIVAALDWEQACLCPAETDIAWWLATRRQMLEVNGLDADPELPGFDSRATVIRRFENTIGRALVDLEWHEIFAMARMGCCIVRMQTLLRQTGRSDHGFLAAPVLPSWAVAMIGKPR